MHRLHQQEIIRKHHLTRITLEFHENSTTSPERTPLISHKGRLCRERNTLMKDIKAAEMNRQIGSVRSGGASLSSETLIICRRSYKFFANRLSQSRRHISLSRGAAPHLGQGGASAETAGGVWGEDHPDGGLLLRTRETLSVHGDGRGTGNR